MVVSSERIGKLRDICDHGWSGLVNLVFVMMLLHLAGVMASKSPYLRRIGYCNNRRETSSILPLEKQASKMCPYALWVELLLIIAAS